MYKKKVSLASGWDPKMKVQKSNISQLLFLWYLSALKSNITPFAMRFSVSGLWILSLGTSSNGNGYCFRSRFLSSFAIFTFMAANRITSPMLQTSGGGGTCYVA